jgi:predicted RecA/RadA family phage recombinase
MKNAVSSGNVIAHTPSAAVSSGQLVLVGTKLGVAVADIAANATGSLQMSGEFSFGKVTTDVVAQGAALYWNNTSKLLTTTSAGNTYAGYATAAAGNGAATVNINLNR